MNTSGQSPSTSFTVLTCNPVHEVKNMSWKLENALMTVDSTYAAILPLPNTCPVRVKVLAKFRRLSTECIEVSVGLQRTDKRRNISVQMTYDLHLANCDRDVYATKRAVMQLDGNVAPHFVLSAKFTNSSVRSNGGDPDCVRLDTTILQALATKNLFVLSENQEIFFLLPGNVLFIVGDFTVIGCCTSTRPVTADTSPKEVPVEDGKELLVRELKTALDEGVQTDIKIKVEEDEDNTQIYNLHKFVLAARSPFFRDLLEQNRSKESQVYTVTGARAGVFDALVGYLYTGEAESMDDVWAEIELYSMAVQFRIDPLRAECARRIAATMSEEEVWDVLEVAVKYEDEELKEMAIDFVTSRPDVVDSERLAEFMETRKDLAAAVLRSIIAKKRHD